MKAAQQLAFLFITTIGYAQHEMTIGEQYQLKATDKIDLSVPSMPETTQQEFSVWGDEMPSELSEPPKIKIKKQQHSEPNNFYQHQIQKSKQKFNETFGTDKIKMSAQELQEKITQIIQNYNAEQHLKSMKQFVDYELSEQEFAQLLGRARLYQHLPKSEKLGIPALHFNDSQLNTMAKDYYEDPYFSRENEGSINLWKVYNLFTS